MSTNPVLSARGRYGFAVKSGDEALISSAGSELAASKIAAYIERVVQTAPPLTDDQRARLAGLLGVVA